MTATYEHRHHNRFLHDAWHFLVKYGAGIAVIIYGTWTAVTWYTNREDQINSANTAARTQKMAASEIALRDSQRPFLEKQLAFYFEAAKVAGKLATLPPISAEYPKDQRYAEDWGWAKRRFWELYWGELGVVESPEVATAMINFGNALRDLQLCVEAGGNCIDKQAGLTGPSIQLAHQVRQSIQNGWGYQLPELPDRK